MRTKTLLGLAALAVGLSTSMAQVYSVNVVGYVNVPLAAGKLSFLSLPVAPIDGNYNITNTINMTGATGDQSFATLIRWTGTQWAGAVTWFDPQDGGTGWNSSSVVISNGVGFFIRAADTSTLTFVGQVPQGPFTYNLPTGLSAMGNAVPVTTNFPGIDNAFNSFDTAIQWDFANQQWKGAVTFFSIADGGTGWNGASPDGPLLNPADAMFYHNTGSAATFTRSFTVQ